MKKSVLTEEEIKKAHKIYSGGSSLVDVAKEFGTTRIVLRNQFANNKLEVRRPGPPKVAASDFVIRGVIWKAKIMSQIKEEKVRLKQSGESVTIQTIIGELLEEGMKIYKSSEQNLKRVQGSDINRQNTDVPVGVCGEIDEVITQITYKKKGHHRQFYTFSEFCNILVKLAFEQREN